MADTDLDVNAFLNSFITRPLAGSPEAIKAKILFWIERANYPEQFSDGAIEAVRYVRRKARQNVRRLALKYPDVAASLKKGAA